MKEQYILRSAIFFRSTFSNLDEWFSHSRLSNTPRSSYGLVHYRLWQADFGTKGELKRGSISAWPFQNAESSTSVTNFDLTDTALACTFLDRWENVHTTNQCYTAKHDEML